MIIHDNIKIIDLALLIKDTLVITDTQIGYEESLNKQGVLIPRFQYKDLHDRLKKILDITKPKKIIINGDIKHEFGTISETEWRHTLKLIDFLAEFGEAILVKGNHDTILGPIAKKRNIKIVDHYVIDDIYLCHGHKIPKDFGNCKTIIIGHEHPAVALKDNGRSEKYKCYLKGKYEDKTLIVQPSFNLVTEGSDVLSEKLLSPFLSDIRNFEVYVVSDKILFFGKTKHLI